MFNINLFKKDLVMSNPFENLTKIKSFNAEYEESLLKKHSEKLIFSTRVYPELVIAGLAIFTQRYPGQGISSASELLYYIIADYVSRSFIEIDKQLPTTEFALNHLIENKFINPNSRAQFRKLSLASAKAEELEESIVENSPLTKQYEYYRHRDPVKAQVILEKLSEELSEALDKPISGVDTSKRVTPEGETEVVSTISMDNFLKLPPPESQPEKKKERVLSPAEQFEVLKSLQTIPEKQS